jgi:hypothetical protein
LFPAGDVCTPCAPPSGGRPREWTADPDVELVKYKAEITARVVKAREQLRSSEKPDGGKLLHGTGEWLKEITGHRDASFFQVLPEAGAKVVYLRALCNKYEKSLHDGDDTLSGAFVDALERILGMPIMRCNITMTCQRKGKDGVEPKGGQAGCVDPTGERLKVLGFVKELHFLGLRAAGLEIVAIIASSNASILSFDNLSFGKHFEQQVGTGTYAGVPIFTTMHPKYVSPTCRFTSAVARALGVSLGDPLAVTSAVLDGWACMAVSIVWLQRLEDESFEEFEEAVRMVYEALRNDPMSQVVAREWELRHTTTTSPETHARLEAALGEHLRAMHAGIKSAETNDPLQRSK